jgi:transcriptional regulator with XRE-family HTH domain
MVDYQKFEIQRRKLGMSRAALAKYAGVSLPTITRLLTGREANPSASTLHLVAKSLGMSIALGAEPRIEVVERPQDLRLRRAEQKARRIAGLVQGTMGLEAQAVGKETLDQIVNESIHRLLAGSNRQLWSD